MLLGSADCGKGLSMSIPANIRQVILHCIYQN